MPYGWSSIQRTAATTSGRSSRLTSHNQERSLKRVCSPQGLSSFFTDVGETEISVSSDATASLSMNSHRTQLGWDQRIFFYRGTPPECAKKVPINRFLPHHVKQHAEVCRQKDRDFKNEPGQG